MRSFLAEKLCLLFLLITPICNAERRLAILPSGNTGETLADLLTAELGKRKNIALVERTELNRVWREQSITQLSSASVVRAGTLLNAQGILVLDAQKLSKGYAARLRLIGVKSGAGVGWWQYTIPADKVAGWATLAADRLEEIVVKLDAESSHLARISFVGFTSPTESSDSRQLQREINSLFLNRLGREGSFMVLEREKLLEASFEKILGDDDQRFWNGSYLLDGTINPRELAGETVEVQVRLSAPGNAQPVIFSISGRRDALAQLAERFSEGIRKAINTSAPVSRWDSKMESMRFFNEAQVALRAGFWQEAMTAIDTALALGNVSLETRLVRVAAYTGFMTPDYRESFFRSIKPGFGIMESYSPTVSTETLGACVDTAHQLKEFAAAATLQGEKLRPNISNAIEGLGVVAARFYYGVELRKGHEEALEQLRRTMTEVVTAYVSEYKSTLTNSTPPMVTQDLVAFLALLRHYAPLWGDTPEEGLELHRLFRSLPISYSIEEIAGKSGDVTWIPELCGWKWSDRQRAENAWKSYEAELKLLNKAAGHLQSIGNAGSDLTLKTNLIRALDFFRVEQNTLRASGFRTGFIDALGTSWNQQADLVATELKSAILNSEIESLKQTLSEIDRSTANRNVLFPIPTSSMRSRPADRIALIVSKGEPPTRDLILQLQMASQQDKFRALEILPKIRDLPDSKEKTAVLPQVEQMISSLQRQFSPRPSASPRRPTEPPLATSPSEPAMTLTARAIPLGTTNSQPYRVLWIDGVLWVFQQSSDLRSIYDQSGGQRGFSIFHQSFVSRFDPRTATTEHIEIPDRYFTIQQQPGNVEFAAFPNRLIFLLEAGWLTYDRRTRSFDLQPAPIANAHLFQTGTNLLFYNSDTILRGIVGSDKFEVLASIRRRPPGGALDTLTSYEGVKLLGNESGEIALVLPSGSMTWSESKWIPLSDEKLQKFTPSSTNYNSFPGTDFSGSLLNGQFSLTMSHQKRTDAVLTLKRGGQDSPLRIDLKMPGRGAYEVGVGGGNVLVADDHLFIWSPNAKGVWWIPNQRLKEISAIDKTRPSSN